MKRKLYCYRKTATGETGKPLEKNLLENYCKQLQFLSKINSYWKMKNKG